MGQIALICGIAYYLAGLWWVVRTGAFLWVFWRFWRAERRDLYFIAAKERADLLGANLGGFLIGVVWMLAPILMVMGNPPAWACLYPYLGLLAGFALAVLLAQWLPVHPPWVQHFEEQRSREDIERIQSRGQLLLNENYDTFLRAIHTQVGWDLWVMTVV